MNQPPRPTFRSRIPGIAFAALLIGIATLVPVWGSPKPNVGFACLLCGDAGASDLVLNVLLFLPLGVAVARGGMRPFHALGLGLALSGTIEIVQVMLPGRSATLRDVLSNSFGCWLGAYLTFGMHRWLAPARFASLRLWLAVLVSVSAVAFTGIMLRTAPSDGMLFVHWSPRQRHLQPWTGRILVAHIGSRALPRGPERDPAALRSALALGDSIRIRGRAGDATTRLGGIMTISDLRRNEVLLIGPRGTDLIVRSRRKAADLRFNAPEVRFPGLLGTVPAGAPMDLTVAGTHDLPCVRLNSATQCAPRASAGSGWALLRFQGSGHPLVHSLLDALTLLVLASPVGLLLRVAPRMHRLLAPLALLAGTALAAWLTGLRLPGIAELLGLFAGLAVGAAVARRSAYIHRAT